MNGCALQTDRPTAYVLLAAGRGQRFGQGKLTADLCGRPLWRWAIDAAIEAEITSIRVVTNDAQIANACAQNGWTVIANPDAATGIASSIRLAAQVAPLNGNVIVALADMPFVEPAHLRRLCATGRTAFTQYPGMRAGVPASFTYDASRRLLSLEDDRGAASLDWPDAEVVPPPSADTLHDVDTPEVLERAREIAIRRFRGACR